MAVIKYKDPITGEIKKVGTPIVDAYNKAETEEKLSSAIAQAENYTDRQVATLITENDARQLIEEAMSGFQPEGGGGSDVTVSNSFAKVKVGTTTISADAINDTLILMAGNNVTLTPDADNDSVTISATNTTYSAATTSTNGLMTAAMVTKLNGIAAGANAYTHPSHTAKSSGLYKVTVDGNGHVSAATAVQKSDITALGIPAQDTTYGAASTSANGLMTTTMVSKLNGIATGAEVNQNAFSNVTVGSTTIAADSKTDTLTLVAGSNVTITPDANNDKITIAATDTVYTHPTSAGNKHIPSGGSSGQILRWSASGTAVWGDDNNTTYSNATASAAGLMSASDKSKLDGIAANANNYSLPTASSSTLGGVKIGSNISISSGTISLTSANVTSALGYTPLSSAPVTSVNGETGNVSVKVINSSDGAGYAALTMDSNGTAIWAAFNSSHQARWAIQDVGGSSPHILTHHYYTNGNWQGSASIYSTANKPTLAELGITSGTAALTAGSSPLATDTIYIQYE